MVFADEFHVVENRQDTEYRMKKPEETRLFKTLLPSCYRFSQFLECSNMEILIDEWIG